jgi:hypothetical protein
VGRLTGAKKVLEGLLREASAAAKLDEKPPFRGNLAGVKRKWTGREDERESKRREKERRRIKEIDEREREKKRKEKEETEYRRKFGPWTDKELRHFTELELMDALVRVCEERVRAALKLLEGDTWTYDEMKRLNKAFNSLEGEDYRQKQEKSRREEEARHRSKEGGRSRYSSQNYGFEGFGFGSGSGSNCQKSTRDGLVRELTEILKEVGVYVPSNTNDEELKSLSKKAAIRIHPDSAMRDKASASEVERRSELCKNYNRIRKDLEFRML